MSMEKAIEHGKEKRKPYKGAKAIDHTCRNHGSCEWCRGARLFFDTKKRTVADDELNAYLAAKLDVIEQSDDNESHLGMAANEKVDSSDE